MRDHSQTLLRSTPSDLPPPGHQALLDDTAEDLLSPPPAAPRPAPTTRRPPRRWPRTSACARAPAGCAGRRAGPARRAAGVPPGREPVGVPDEHRGGMPASGASACARRAVAGAVEPAHRRQRSARHHVAGQLDLRPGRRRRRTAAGADPARHEPPGPYLGHPRGQRHRPRLRAWGAGSCRSPALVATSTTPHDPPPEVLGVQPGASHHGHATHRVPAEHHRSLRCHDVEHRREVVAEHPHVGGSRSQLELAVPALVIADDPDTGGTSGSTTGSHRPG